MKIISKYKDYYDYLQGVYGVDEKIVLDRRTDNIVRRHKLYFGIYEFEFVGICINDKLYSGVYENETDSFWFGEDLRKFENKKSYFSIHNIFSSKKDSMICIYNDHQNFILNTQPIDCNLNSIYDCPILLITDYENLKYARYDRLKISSNSVYTYPILKEFNFASVLNPKEIYLEIYSWLSKKITEKENKRNTKIDNNQKIESKGFDPKTSFRPKIKNP